MIQGLYTAASGMFAVEAKQSALSNNIANTSTPGYKRAEPILSGFYAQFSKELQQSFHFDVTDAPGGGVRVGETFSDLSAGVLTETDNPLQMALQGPGFFVVNTPAGERYTRTGAFVVDPQGQLATQDGYKVQGVGGQPIDVRGTKVEVGTDGNIRVDNTSAGQLRLLSFASTRNLKREGNSIYSASAQDLASAKPPTDTFVQGKSLESSNVNLPKEITEMMLGMRAYEANQKVVQAIDATMGRLIDQLGFPS